MATVEYISHKGLGLGITIYLLGTALVGKWYIHDGQWHDLQSVLCSLYVTQSNVAYAANAPLFNCTVVIDEWCNYSVGLEPELTLAFVAEKDVSQVDTWNQQRSEKLRVHTLALEQQQQETEATASDEGQVFDRVAVGGTFDHIHAGHKILLTMTALLASKSIVVGVTDDSMLKSKKHREYIASTQERIANVIEFLGTVRRGLVYDVVPISDPFGPTITDPSIQALVVSLETEKGGEAVNRERLLRDFPKLELRMIDVISSDNASVSGQDLGALKISSTWIREYIARQQQK
ncbi:hypothetical protein BJV82DRAFT_642465 [Fennellomyces sp. T-0311]|nr:hypothetical protein BJV82DRAFT_642465 [Fennellomyces sp. T-0311]